MTQQVDMPEPVAHLNPYGGLLTTLTTGMERETFTIGLITTDQAEAYADARVQEALECASREVHNVLHPTNQREDWTQYAYIREEAAHDAESAIRALIPQTNTRP